MKYYIKYNCDTANQFRPEAFSNVNKTVCDLAQG